MAKPAKASATVKTTEKKTKKKVKKSKAPEPEEIFVDEEYEKESEGKEIASKRRDRNFFVAFCIIIVAVIILVVIGTQYRNYNINKDEYNHFKFFQKDGRWETFIDAGEGITPIQFYHHPRELEGFITEPGIQFKVPGHQGNLIITTDPNLNSTVSIAGVQISRITGERFGILNIPTTAGITNFPDYEINESSARLIVTCDNASNETIVIWLKKGIVNSLYSDGNCVIIEGTDEENLVMGAEKLGYMMLGIMS